MFDTSRPSSSYDPLVGRSRQPTMFISVDLPEPDVPMMATYSLAEMSMSTPSSARIRSGPTV
jgi:hypothetical protein